MVADPKLMPFTLGGTGGAVAPAGIKMFAGVTVSFEVSLLVSMRMTPPAGAAVANVTGNGTDWPGATVTLAGSMIPDPNVNLPILFPKYSVNQRLPSLPTVIPSGALPLVGADR